MPGNELVPLHSGPVTPRPPSNMTRAQSVVDLDQVDAFGQLRATWDILLKHQWLILLTAFVMTVLVARLLLQDEACLPGYGPRRYRGGRAAPPIPQ